MGAERLVRKAQNGDKDAFMRLIRDNELALYRAARSLLHREEDVEDAVQETVCRAFSRLPDLRKPQFFKTWLTRILINCSYDILRAQKGLSPLEVLPETGAVDRDTDLSLDVRAALDALSENNRLVMTLFYLNDLPIKEIAQTLGISESAVKQRLVQGRKRFRQIYEEREGTA